MTDGAYGRIRQLWADVDHATRRRAVLLSALMLISMTLEMIGIGAVLPVVGLLIGDGAVASQLRSIPALSDIAGADRATLITGAMTMMVAFFGIKGLFQALVARRIAAFTYGLQADYSRRLLSIYLHQPYPFHLTRNSAQLSSAVNNEARDVATAVNNLLSVAAEGMILVGVVGLLLVASPGAGLMIAGLVGGAGLVIVRVTRTGMIRQGTRMRSEHALKMQALIQALHGAKELLLLGRQDAVLAGFDVHNQAHADAARRQVVLASMPRLWLEFLAVAGLALLVVALGRAGDTAIVPLVGLFAAAAFRLIPSINRIVSGLQSQSYFAPTVDHVLSELALPMPRLAAADRALRLKQDLVIDSVTYAYPGGGPLVLANVSLRIARGAMVGLVGASGAGKSSLIDVITGLLPPNTGRVLVDGVGITDNLRGWQSRIGYVPQALFLIDDTLRRNIALGVADAAIDEDAVLCALRLAQINGLLDELPDGLDTMMGDRGQRLSGGQRQRVAIARALYHQPDLLVIDEGTSALDTATEAEVMRTLQGLRGTMTIIVATHREAVLDGCDQVVRIASGGSATVR